MEERLKQLKDGLDGYLNVENKFTETQKVKIRKAIAKERTAKNRFFSANWMKQGLSIAVACSLFLAIGAFAFINMTKEQNGIMSMDSGAGEANKAAESRIEMAELPKSDANSTEITQNDAEDSQLVGEKLEVPEPILPLSDEMQQLYAQFKENPDQELLRGLEPYKVMQLYYYADSENDFETQYEFYVKDERYLVPPKDMFLSDVKEDPNIKANTQKLKEELSGVTKMTQVIFEAPDDGYLQDAVIQYETSTGQIGFRLLKNNEGIWTVAWLPTQ